MATILTIICLQTHWWTWVLFAPKLKELYIIAYL